MKTIGSSKRTTTVATRTVAMAALAGLVLTGCASDDAGGEVDDQDTVDEPSTSDADPAASPAAAATGDPFRVGWLTDASGVVRMAYFPEYEGARLYFETVNAQGGVHGRPVEVEVGDIGVDQELAVTEATRFAEDDEVIMLAGGTIEGRMPAIFEVVRANELAYMTGHSARPDMLPPEPDPWLFTAGNVFEAMSDARTMVWPAVFGEEFPDGGTVGCYVHESPAKTAVCDRWFESLSSQTDWEGTVHVNAPIDAADVTPFLTPVINNPPDAFFNISQPHVGPVSVALRNSGYTGALVFTMTSVPEHDIRTVVEQVGGDNVWTVSEVVSIDDEDVPAVQEILDAADEFGTEIAPNAATIKGWIMGKVIVEALERCGADCTREGLRESLEQTDVDTEGLTGGPVRFTEEDHTGPRYWTGYRWDDGAGRLARVTDEWITFDPSTDFLEPVVVAGS